MFIINEKEKTTTIYARGIKKRNKEFIKRRAELLGYKTTGALIDVLLDVYREQVEEVGAMDDDKTRI